MRTTRKIVTFGNPFSIKGLERVLPAGDYEVITDEELIEGLSFPVYRHVATLMLAPGASSPASTTEMLTVDPHELAAALQRDAAAVKGISGSANAP
ncbi:MAG TPA: hypothetical protein VFB45_03295 [Pseudolabrys sp.]|nr:hypothetical protein [Pseudolabrys sp.]